MGGSRAFRVPIPDNGGVTRLDQLLCERGLVETRSRAQALVMAGRVRVDGRVVTKAGTPTRPTPRSRSTRGPRTCRAAATSSPPRSRPSRSTSPGSRCLDVGASTGGFTDCLLQRGAAHVTALDVGRGQLHERLRADDRVTLLEGVNARLLAPGELPGPPATLAVVDVSFISLSLVLPPLAGCARASLPRAAAREAAVRGRAQARCAAGSCGIPPSTRRCSSASPRSPARRAASCSARARAAIRAPPATASSSSTSSPATTRRPSRPRETRFRSLRDAVA